MNSMERKARWLILLPKTLAALTPKTLAAVTPKDIGCSYAARLRLRAFGKDTDHLLLPIRKLRPAAESGPSQQHCKG